MTASGGRGSALHIDATRIRFARKTTPGLVCGAKLSARITEVRRLLRSNLSICDIAAQLGVSGPTFRRFVRQRNLCDLKNRRDFIMRQASVETLEREA